MMKKQMYVCLATLAMIGLGIAPVAAAGHIASSEARPRPEPGMGYKFGRGAVNVLTCWTEVPRNVAIEWQRTDPASGFFLGVGKGLGYGYARFMGGVFDMVTFPFPVPMGFAPVMDPEFSVANEYSNAPTEQFIVEALEVDGDAQSGRMDDYASTPKRQWP